MACFGQLSAQSPQPRHKSFLICNIFLIPKFLPHRLLGIEYLINEWLMAGADYTYREKDSSSGENDYTDNRFLVTFGVTY